MIILGLPPGLSVGSFVTNSVSLKIQLDNKTNSQFQDYVFLPGLHVIYGESGSGKTALIDTLTSNSKSESKKCKVIYQNPDSQIISNTIENELSFGLECNSKDSLQIGKKLNEIENELLFSVDTNRHPVTLSGGEKELLNISTTFSLPADIILIDNALSFLSDQLKSKVVEKYLTNKQSGTIIIWTTSDESDLKFGNTKWELTSNGLLEKDKISLTELPKKSIPKGGLELDIKNLSFYYDRKTSIFNNFTKNINSFRCLGISGNNGSGKSTLASLLLYVEKPVSGSIKLSCQNEDVDIGYLDQFPEKLLGVMTLQEFVNLLINNKKLNNLQLVKIKSTLGDNNIFWEDINNILALDLSWSILRIALIIILLNCNYDLLILDEPTFGMGSKQKVNLLSYFEKYLEEKHLILISHEHSFINSICDSIIEL